MKKCGSCLDQTGGTNEKKVKPDVIEQTSEDKLQLVMHQKLDMLMNKLNAIEAKMDARAQLRNNCRGQRRRMFQTPWQYPRQQRYPQQQRYGYRPYF